ncbi:MAG TPA: tetratricopeptide repeat protein [Gammaproteobacteria bacterium]
MRIVQISPCFPLLPLILLVAMLSPAANANQDIGGEAPRIQDRDILALNDRLMRLADYYVKPGRTTERQIDTVISLMFDRDKLGLVYKRDKTSTVQETVAGGGGNCLSLAAVFVALARYVGLDASFVSVAVPPNWREAGVEDLYVVSQHMSAEVTERSRMGRKKHAVEFLWVLSTPGNKNRKAVSDERAFADFYNNIAVESLQQSHLADALYYAEKSIAAEPRYAYAWLTRGVIQRKLGDDQEAEKSYITSLKIDKRNFSAMNNLVSLYRMQGRDQEAKRYLKKVERYRMKNPYYLHSLAEKAIAAHSYKEAISLLKRAIKKAEYEDKLYFTLAKAYHLYGKHQLAIENLDKARALVTDPAVRARYGKKLDLLQESVSSG